MNSGGAETFLMKIYRKIDKSKIQFDFIVSKDGTYDNEIMELGGKIFKVPMKSENPIGSIFAIYNVVKNHKYKYVFRIAEHSLSTLDLVAAKLGGAKKLILRSINSEVSGGFLSKFLHILFLPLSLYVPNVRIAPSTEAANHLFRNKKCFIINNGIDVDLFKFDYQKRLEMRRTLNISDKFVMIHIGRFSKQKNHEYLIEIFKNILMRQTDSYLLLVGDGELLKSVKDKVETLGISNSVKFLGNRNDVPELLMAADFLCFPSYFEGMPNVIIEAQGTGLPCLISDTITREANITDIVKYISLKNKNSIEWANKAINMGQKNIYRETINEKIKKAGYDINDVAKRFEKIIFG